MNLFLEMQSLEKLFSHDPNFSCIYFQFHLSPNSLLLKIALSLVITLHSLMIFITQLTIILSSTIPILIIGYFNILPKS